MSTIQVECNFCKKLFQKKRYLAKQKLIHYCSYKCHHDSMRTPGSTSNGITLKCCNCNKKFTRLAKDFAKNSKKHFCSNKCCCYYNFNGKQIKCKNCGKLIYKSKARIRKNNFCSLKCSGIYNYKTHNNGNFNNRSKLELFLEKHLNKKYPNLNIIYNDRKTIYFEIDIYIPDINLAFEINGAFHYKPIFGEERLKRIQANDKKKAEICKQKGIKLAIINTSSHKEGKNFKPKCFEYLNEITDIIDKYI